MQCIQGRTCIAGDCRCPPFIIFVDNNLPAPRTGTKCRTVLPPTYRFRAAEWRGATRLTPGRPQARDHSYAAQFLVNPSGQEPSRGHSEIVIIKIQPPAALVGSWRGRRERDESCRSTAPQGWRHPSASSHSATIWLEARVLAERGQRL